MLRRVVHAVRYAPQIRNVLKKLLSPGLVVAGLCPLYPRGQGASGLARGSEE
jgi:hypothetical protein